ncbi:transporter [Pseudaminobacter arsenicus]|uniref:Transporter n=1 Tax=Borborobacter arsenicus TaxID=1851146 RepID=A0A432UZW2_9HYPH|nr:OmpP1/FadL family transporter [Pseudaminobacter arsenicus]RUM95497.1 transporter [Pseudaminobacter arsenicus]
MDNAAFKSILGVGCLSLAAATMMVPAAHAGGLERGGYNIDLLFDPARFASEASVTYVMPQRDLENVVDVNPSNGIGANGLGSGATSVRDSESYAIPRIGFKAAFGESVDCMGDYSQPWGAHSNPGADWMGANSNIETKIHSHNFAGTCSYKMQAGKGQFRFIGGVFHQEVGGFKERLVAPIPTLAGGTDAFGNGVGRLDLEGDGIGWRVGAAYEIPEIAFRASLVYNSEVDLGDITGTLDLRQVPGFVIPTSLLPADSPQRLLLGQVINVSGNQKMPDSLEFKVQSGIAPDWLAFGSVKWVDWSQLQTVRFCVVGMPGPCTAANQATSLELLYRDGWTISGGLGHKFNDQWSGAASINWDRGTSTTVGTQSDTWSFSAGASYTPTKNVELRFGGVVGILTSGSSTDSQITYDYGNDFVGALSASARVKF